MDERLRDHTADESHGVADRVALFGGSFDPPHRGHVAIASAAAEVFRLGSILFAPTGLQPMKPQGAASAFKDRLAMTSLACDVDERFSVSEIDGPRPDGGPNYTVNALTELRHQLPGARLFAIVGADSFLEFPRWHESERLLELAEWIVVSRPGFALTEISGMSLPERVRDRIHLLEGVHETISATKLRDRLGRGEDCSDAVPGSVLAYIEGHHLYGC